MVGPWNIKTVGSATRPFHELLVDSVSFHNGHVAFFENDNRNAFVKHQNQTRFYKLEIVSHVDRNTILFYMSTLSF